MNKFNLLYFIVASLLLILPVVVKEEINVYLLIGQSNMEGVGRNSKLKKENIANVEIFHSSNIGDSDTANRWVPVCPCGWKGTQSGGFGIEIPFARELAKANSNLKYGFIKHARGGTSIAGRWKLGVDPSIKRQWGSEYKIFRATAEAALEALEKKGKAPIIRGILWQQGEKDARDEKRAKAYETNLKRFIAFNRKEFARYAKDKKPKNIRFILGQVIPDYTKGSKAFETYPFRQLVREAQLKVAKDIDNVITIETDKTFSTHATEKDGYRDQDNIHFNAEGILKLGRKMAKAALK